MKSKVTKTLWRISGVFIVIVALFAQQVMAVTQDTIHCAQAGSLECFYEPSACTASTTSVSPSAASGKSAWNSTATPPYYLEEYVINILQDLAQTLNVPQSDTVTQEHVVAMVAWAQAEGGNLVASDPNPFNVWNMGFLSSNPNLFVGGSGSTNGTSTGFASFNDGVEGYAIVLTGSYQSRIGAILSQPNSTADQVISAIANPSQTSGNMEWATNPNYYNSLVQDLQSTRGNYDQLASVVIGPGQYSTSNVPTSELQFNGGQSNSGSTTLSSSGSGSSCSCSSSTTGSAAAATTTASTSSSGGPTIVLDPGHATQANELVDPATDEPVFDYSNPVEQQQVWDMAVDLKTKLTAAGYNVLITKNSENDTNTNLKERAEVGNNANAALGVSLHTTPGATDSGNDVFVPVVGEYLVKVSGQHDVYTNQTLANTDLGYANTMAQSLGQATNGLNFKVGGYGQIFGPITREVSGVTMQGTMLVTEYFATVPWLYIERYQDSPTYGTTTQAGMDDYEAGVLNGIEKIVPVNSSNTGSTTSTASAGSGCSETNTNCQGATGNTAILCEAQQYNGIYYEYAGGHQGYQAFIAGCPDPSNPPHNQPNGGPVNGDPAGLSGNPSPCATDCSALVSIALDEAFNQNYMWTVDGSGIMQGGGANYWKSIPIANAQPGDIVTQADGPNGGHVEIVDHVSGSTIYTFGSHETGTTTGEISSPTVSWTGGAYRWTGPGSNGS